MEIKNMGYVFILISLLLCPLQAFPESNLSNESMNPGDEMMLFQEIPSVYSASKYEQKVTEAPSSVSIITADEIKKYGYRDLGEILESIRGFYVTYDRTYKYLGVRGFGLPSDYSNRILVLVDGIRINDNIYDSPLIDTAFPLEIDLIDRIEVVRGPSSSLYGSNAFFAVVNIFTKSGRDLKGTEVSGEAGTFNTHKTRFSYGNKYQNGLEVLLSTSFYGSEGNDSLDYGSAYNENPWICPDSNPDNCYRLKDIWPAGPVASGLDYDRYKNFFAEMKFKDFTLQGNYHSRKKGIPTASYETVFNEGPTFTIDERYWVDMKYEHTSEERLSVLARLNYNVYKYLGEYQYGDYVEDDSSKGEWVSGEIQLTKPLLEKHKITSGAVFQLNLKQEQKTAIKGVANEAPLDDKRRTDNWALFIQDEFNIMEHLILNGGLRYDHYNTFGGTANPRLALIYNPVEKTTFKAVYGRSFRAPSNYEFYFGDGGLTVKANPALKPETINTYELIYEQYIGKYLRGTAVGFYYKINDLIKQDKDPSDGLLVYNNIDTVTAHGAEFELEGKWESGLEGRISYTFQETKDEETGRILTNSPKHLVKANLILPVIKDKIFLNFEEHYTSRRRTLYREKQEALPASLRADDFPSDHYADSFFITNVTLYTKHLLKNLEASGSVYNLFDKKYGDPGAGEHFQDTIEQNGRSFRLKLTYCF